MFNKEILNFFKNLMKIKLYYGNKVKRNTIIVLFSCLMFCSLISASNATLINPVGFYHDGLFNEYKDDGLFNEYNWLTTLLSYRPAIDPTKSIQEEIDDSFPGDTIILGSGTYNQNNINITKPVTIKAETQGTVTVNATMINTVFNIKSPNVTIDGLTITGGKATSTNCGSGIAIVAASSFSYPPNDNNSIMNCNITDNVNSSTAYSGSGIWIQDSSNNLISNCNITNNTGYIGSGGVNIVATLNKWGSSNNNTIMDCSISDNTAIDSGGGGVNIYGYNENITYNKIVGCTLVNNKAIKKTGGGGGWNTDCGGGGINLYMNGNNCSNNNISNCTLIGNYANGTGSGGINIYGTNNTVSGSTILSNYANGTTSTGGFGGGLNIYNTLGENKVNYCRVLNNTALKGAGSDLCSNDGSGDLGLNWWGQNNIETSDDDEDFNKIKLASAMKSYYLVRLTANTSTNSLSNTTSGSVLHCSPENVTLSYDLVLNTTNTSDNVTNLPYFTGTHQVDTGVYTRSLREVLRGLNRLFNPLAIGVPVSGDARINYNNTTLLNPGDNATLNSSVDNENINITALADQLTPVNLTVNKTVDKTSVNVGDTVNYTINVSNNGSLSVSNVNVSDSLPSGLSFISTNDTTNYNNSTGIWNIGEITNGLTKSLSIQARVNSNGSINNTATIILPLDYNNTGVNNSTVEVTGYNVDLDVSKTLIGSDEVHVGDNVSFIINLTNKGGLPVSNVNINDTLPSHLTYLTCNDTNYTNDTGIWSIGTINVDETKSLNITTRVNDNNTVITNTALLVLPPDYNNTGVSNDSAELAGHHINLTVNKTVDKDAVYVGDTVNYTINVSNNGNLDVTDLINVNDSLPTGLSFISCNDTNYSSSSGLWSIDRVGVGESRSLSIQCNVAQGGTIENNASIVLPDEYFNTGVNESIISINARLGYDLSLRNEPAGSVVVGSLINSIATPVGGSPLGTDYAIFKVTKPNGDNWLSEHRVFNGDSFTYNWQLTMPGQWLVEVWAYDNSDNHVKVPQNFMRYSTNSVGSVQSTAKEVINVK
jgi:uncharacterized repeat protein (TIGR01451 family)